jgi:hypothetical protein
MLLLLQWLPILLWSPRFDSSCVFHPTSQVSPSATHLSHSLYFVRRAWVHMSIFVQCYHCISLIWSELSLSYGRRPVDQFFLVSGSPLGPMTKFILIVSLWQLLCWSSCRAPSLTRGRVCNLQCNRWLVRLLRTNNHKLPSHLRRCSLSVASYDSQGLRWRYSNPPPHGVAWFGCLFQLLRQSLEGAYEEQTRTSKCASPSHSLTARCAVHVP